MVHDLLPVFPKDVERTALICSTSCEQTTRLRNRSEQPSYSGWTRHEPILPYLLHLEGGRDSFNTRSHDSDSTDPPHSLETAQVEHPHRNRYRSEEHTSELQSQSNLVCRLLLEKKMHFLAL